MLDMECNTSLKGIKDKTLIIWMLKGFNFLTYIPNWDGYKNMEIAMIGEIWQLVVN